MTDLEPQIALHYTTIPSPLPSAPSFVFHLTHLASTLFIWIGTGPPSDGSMAGEGLVSEKKLASDWAVAMPSRGNIPVTSTPVYRAGASDTALPMTQRLAKKFPSNQIHLSLSLPPTLTASSGPSLDPFASKVLLVMEKKLGTWIEEILQTTKTADGQA